MSRKNGYRFSDQDMRELKPHARRDARVSVQQVDEKLFFAGLGLVVAFFLLAGENLLGDQS